MRKRLLPVMLLAATLGMTGCSDEVITDTGGGTEDSGKYAYFNAAISLPSSSGTRSQTDNSGTTNSDGKDSGNNQYDDYEYGYDYENNVRSMILVIAKDSDYITHAVVPSITQTSTSGNEFRFTVKSKIPYDVLEEAYAEDGVLAEDQEVQLYAFCNYTASILDKFQTISDADKHSNWLHWDGTVEEAAAAAGKKPSITNSIWAENSFLMTNAKVYTTDKFPADLTGWEDYATQNNPLDLTKTKDGSTSELEPLPVERVAARIDFKDGSTYRKNNVTVPNTYPILTVVGTDNSDNDVTKELFCVQLTRMALVNMSKNFYYLRRTSSDGQAKDNNGTYHWTVGGTEYGNYVVDVDEEKKITVEGITPANAGDYFNFTLFDQTTGNYSKESWYIDDIDDVLSGKNDNWGGKSSTTTSTPNPTGYKIWRYVTENTIPAKKVDDKDDDVSQQKTVQSTGVVFKGAIIAGKDLTDEDGNVVANGIASAKVAEALQKAALPKATKDADNFDYTFPVLYSFNNILYAGIEELIEAAYHDGQNGPLYSKVEKALESWVLEGNIYKYKSNPTEADKNNILTLEECHSIMYPNEDIEDEEEDDDDTPEGTADEVEKTIDFLGDNLTTESDVIQNFMKAVAKPEIDITVYEATDEGDSAGMGYYCYYFYWNRHNDNLKSGKMGPMEFATVRNNVYKLSVTAINQLGHPRNADHDPDPVKPEDPDEDPMNYIKVQVEVLPWVVRVNDIVF